MSHLYLCNMIHFGNGFIIFQTIVQEEDTQPLTGEYAINITHHWSKSNNFLSASFVWSTFTYFEFQQNQSLHLSKRRNLPWLSKISQQLHTTWSKSPFMYWKQYFCEVFYVSRFQIMQHFRVMFTILVLNCFRFLADLMDTPELIRNVTLCGHLHHGKVNVSQL